MTYRTVALRRALMGGVSAALLSAPAFAAADTDDLETIIVTARRTDGESAVVGGARDRLARTPGAVNVVAAESFEYRNTQGMSDLLRDVPGVLVQKRYGEESRLSIRGSGIGQGYHQRGVLLAQDGVPFADADGFSDFQKVDALSARYVEVYKGGNALRFGGAQLGGAVNLITPTGRTAQSDVMLRAEGGSFDTLRGAAAVAGVFGKFDIYASANAMTSDGFREHSAQSQERATLNMGLTLGEDREVRLIAYGANINQEVPGAVTLETALEAPKTAGTDAVAKDMARDQEVGRISLQTRWRFNDALVFEGGFYMTGMDLRHPISLVIDQQSDTAGAFGRFDWTGTLGGHKADLFAGFSYRSGSTDQQLYVNMAGERGAQFGDSTQKATGLDLFAEARWFATEHLAIVTGGSFGRATRDYENFLNAANNAERNFDWLSPRFGLLWENDEGTQVYANITRSVEPPHFGALVQSPYPGFVPNDPQEAWTGEIGTRGRTGDLLWDVTLYRAHVENELLTFAGEYGIPAATANADKTIHQGLEAAADWTVMKGDETDGSLTLSASYTFSDFKFDDDATYGNNRLPVVPRHQLRISAKYEGLEGFFIAPSLEWRPSDTWVDYANTMRAPGYAIVSLNTGWELGNDVTLFVDARNLTDKKYAPEIGAIADASAEGANLAVFYPGEGVSIFGGMRYRF